MGRLMTALLTALYSAAAGVVLVSALRPSPCLAQTFTSSPRASIAPAFGASGAATQLLENLPFLAAQSDDPALVRRYDDVVVATHRPDVVVAVAQDVPELAITRDDGRTWWRIALPEAIKPPVVVGITPSGDVLAASREGKSPWLRLDYRRQEVALQVGIEGVDQLAATDRMMFARLRENGFRYSRDDGRTWVRGPDAPNQTHTLEVTPRGEVVATYSWSAGCGGGGEGFEKWTVGASEWTHVSDGFGAISFDGWVYEAGSQCVANERETALCARRASDEGPGVAALPLTEPPRFELANGPTSTIVRVGRRLYVAREGKLELVSDDVPSSLSQFAVDARGRLIGVANGHVVRWSHETGFRTFLF